MEREREKSRQGARERGRNEGWKVGEREIENVLCYLFGVLLVVLRNMIIRSIVRIDSDGTLADNDVTPVIAEENEDDGE